MAKTMTPSKTTTITAGQIGKIQEVLGAALRKSGLQSKPTQQVVTSKSAMGKLTGELLATVRKYVEMVSDMIVRHVGVKRSQSPQEVLNATGRKQYATKSVVATMPKGEGEKTEAIFFKVGRYISDDDLEKEYELRGLTPADPYSLAKVNEDDPAFADEHPNATHWKDADGKWCYVAFYRWYDGRRVSVRRDGGDWGDHWWFAGFRKDGT